jgi:hypothetical protein
MVERESKIKKYRVVCRSPNGCIFYSVIAPRILGQSRRPRGFSKLKASRKYSNLNKIKISLNHVYHFKQFISPLQINISALPNGLWSLLVLS